MRLCSRRFAQAIRSASSSSNDAACPQPADVAVTFRSKILWITRSAPYCHRDSRSFANEGLRPIAVPVSRIAAIDVEPSPAADAIIFTSAHAVHSHPDDRRALGIPVFTIGHYAREAAHAAGYRLVRIALDAAELEDLVASTVPAGARLLIFTSREGGTTLADDSSWLRYELDWQPVYRTSTASDAELRPALEFLDDAGTPVSSVAERSAEPTASSRRWSTPKISFMTGSSVSALGVPSTRGISARRAAPSS